MPNTKYTVLTQSKKYIETAFGPNSPILGGPPSISCQHPETKGQNQSFKDHCCWYPLTARSSSLEEYRIHQSFKDHCSWYPITVLLTHWDEARNRIDRANEDFWNICYCYIETRNPSGWTKSTITTNLSKSVDNLKSFLNCQVSITRHFLRISKLGFISLASHLSMIFKSN